MIKIALFIGWVLGVLTCEMILLLFEENKEKSI